MNHNTTAPRAAALLAMVALLVACGGGAGSSGSPAPAPSAPSTPTLTASMSKTSYAYNEVPTMVWSSSGAIRVDVDACTNGVVGTSSIGNAGTKAFWVLWVTPVPPGSYSCTVTAFADGGGQTAMTVNWTVEAPAQAKQPPATDGLITASPPITVADCPRLLAAATPVPTLTPGSMQFVGDVLASTDPSVGYDLFARLPGEVLYWVNDFPSITSESIGYGIHETTHKLDGALSVLCNLGDSYRRYYLLGHVATTDLSQYDKATASYAIVAESLPVSLKNDFYSSYIVRLGVPGNTYTMLLDELTAYTNGGTASLSIAKSPTYNYLSPLVVTIRAGSDLHGVPQFMSFLIAYLRAARLNHQETYTAIQSLPLTLVYTQKLWTAAETLLAQAYPYTQAGNNGLGFYVPTDSLAWVYAPEQLAELDLLGITHASSTAWNATYLKP